MLKRFSLSRLLGFLAAIVCTCAILGLAAQVAPAKQGENFGVIILDITSDQQGKGQLPPVAFDHDRHTKGDSVDKTCVSCHNPGTNAARTFKDTAQKNGKAQEDAFHAGCISCHVDMKAKGLSTGPQQAECRSCHNAAAIPSKSAEANRTDGGLDASLHARHIASPLIVAAGSDKNCIVCHHSVEKQVSPGVVADSCRSCHFDRKIAENTGIPAFADIAHKQCISCHQSLASTGVKAPLACSSCHDATTKAGYKKLSPVPRLDAGQPDVVYMGSQTPANPSGDSAEQENIPPPSTTEHTTQTPQSVVPVVFNHKLHEGTTNSCTSCHHKTLQKCSSCHTSTGSPKGGNVPLATAMHMPSSNLSCIGCHETRKTTKAECAGCHTIIPKTKAGKTNCTSCHVPPPSQQQGQKTQPPASLAGIIAASPATVTIGTLSKEFEPVVFQHKEHVEKLVAGIESASPGMMRFHADPYALCASCHHNSPPSAAPPTCVSCHTRDINTVKAALQQNGVPALKAAYHQQCMSCHTGMGLTKPANTACASCHVPRAAGR